MRRAPGRFLEFTLFSGVLASREKRSWRFRPAASTVSAGPFGPVVARARVRAPTPAEEAMGEEDLPAQHTEASPQARVPAAHVHARGARRPQGSPAQGSPPAVGLTWA